MHIFRVHGKKESLDLYGGHMDVGCCWLGANQYLIMLYITIFVLKLENFYDLEYNALELSTLARYLRSKMMIFTLKNGDFYARSNLECGHQCPACHIFRVQIKKESHDLWSP